MADWKPIRDVVVDVLPSLGLGLTEWEMYPERFASSAYFQRSTEPTDARERSDTGHIRSSKGGPNV